MPEHCAEDSCAIVAFILDSLVLRVELVLLSKEFLTSNKIVGFHPFNTSEGSNNTNVESTLVVSLILLPVVLEPTCAALSPTIVSTIT